MPENRPHLVIIGGGFGGLYAALALKHAPLKITLIDKRNFHLFQPLLYQVATGGLSPANIAAPLRSILHKNKNTQIIMGEVVDINVSNRQVILQGDQHIEYDHLLVAAGANTNYFGNDHWEQYAPGLKSIEDALEIRKRVLLAFEVAEQESDPQKIQSLLTFVVAGGGPTGVEMAGALAEIAYHTVKNEFHNFDPSQARIILVEGGPGILSGYSPELSKKAEISLQKMGVEVRVNGRVSNIQSGEVEVKTPEETLMIPAYNVVWAAGVKASPLAHILAEATGVETDRMGRIMIQPDLSLPNHSEIFVIGDMAHCQQNGKPLPGIATVAMQQGEYVAQRILGKTTQPFSYKHPGSMATIGRAHAIAEVGKIKLSGFIAWLAWLFIHLINLVQFTNRLLVLIQWAWNYFTRNRYARLITGDQDFPPK